MVLLLVPRLAAWAGLALGVIMLGALATLLLNPGGPLGVDGPIIHLGVLSLIVAARWRDRLGAPGTA